jgi:hypothetical protein
MSCSLADDRSSVIGGFDESAIAICTSGPEQPVTAVIDLAENLLQRGFATNTSYRAIIPASMWSSRWQ